jgi:hypothetical protein
LYDAGGKLLLKKEYVKVPAGSGIDLDTGEVSSDSSTADLKWVAGPAGSGRRSRRIRHRAGRKPRRASPGPRAGTSGACGRARRIRDEEALAFLCEALTHIQSNLVTAQGTRAVIDREELLTALPDRAAFI